MTITGAVSGCGGDIVAGNFYQSLQSPGYPSGYSHGLNCVWHVTASRGHRIWLNITDINLESHGTCNYDSVSVYDGESVGRSPVTVRLGRCVCGGGVSHQCVIGSVCVV